MSTDLTVHADNGLAAQMEWARAASSAAILPDAYRGKPADVMIAANLGASMGLSPAEALYRISVIKGKPTASAELITANVRKAGHRLRVTGDDTRAVASIWRVDDPEFEFREEWTIDRAAKMGLTGNDNWKKQPGTMLKWRAITACARIACPEALYGVAYVPDEMMDSRPESAVQTVTEALGVATVTDVEPVEAEPVGVEPVEVLASAEQVEHIKAGVKALGLSAVAAKAMLSRVTERGDARTDNLTAVEADAVLAELRVLEETPDPAPEQGTLA